LEFIFVEKTRGFITKVIHMYRPKPNYKTFWSDNQENFFRINE